ncbi:MAG: hypothetical protein KF773_20485 [Deltaproteobacteria bacterium]|nr:hypothetical protein [Deltaproteobacteria bacterium]
MDLGEHQLVVPPLRLADEPRRIRDARQPSRAHDAAQVAHDGGRQVLPAGVDQSLHRRPDPERVDAAELVEHARHRPLARQRGPRDARIRTRGGDPAEMRDHGPPHGGIVTLEPSRRHGPLDSRSRAQAFHGPRLGEHPRHELHLVIIGARGVRPGAKPKVGRRRGV